MATVRIDDEEVQREWESRGFSSQVHCDPPGRAWLNVVSDMDELIMVLEGEIEVELHGKVHRPKLGEEVIVPAGTSHTVRTLGSRPSRRLQGRDRDWPQTD